MVWLYPSLFLKYLGAAFRSPFKEAQLPQALLVGLTLQMSDHVGSFTELSVSGFKSHLEGRWAKIGAMQGNQKEPSLTGVLAQLWGLEEFARL